MKQKSVLHKGKNVLAIHCANTSGGAWLDAGLIDKVAEPAQQVLVAKQKKVLSSMPHKLSIILNVWE